MVSIFDPVELTRLEGRPMVDQAPALRAPSSIAVTVMDPGSGPVPCAFFGKCDGIVVLDTATGARGFHPNTHRTPQSLCNLILATGAGRLVCGFIREPEIRRLRAAGIDVRLGSGGCSVDDLATCFCDLPEA
jgi:hypothetical protein